MSDDTKQSEKPEPKADALVALKAPKGVCSYSDESGAPVKIDKSGVVKVSKALAAELVLKHGFTAPE